MYVCAWCSCVGFISLQKCDQKNPSVFEKLYVNIVGEKLTFVVRRVFIYHLKWWRKQMMFMNNSGDVDDAEADYTCPSWIRAFDVCCIFVGGVVRSGQEKQRKRVLPDTSQAHCSNTATYFTPLLLLQEIYWQIVACVIYAIKHLCIFIPNMKKTECSLALYEDRLFTSLWSQSAPVAWHHISPCLLTGLGIYCNAIVLDRIGPVLTMMMPLSLNLESLLLCWGPYTGTGMCEGGSGFQVEKHTPSFWPSIDN